MEACVRFLCRESPLTVFTRCWSCRHFPLKRPGSHFSPRPLSTLHTPAVRARNLQHSAFFCRGVSDASHAAALSSVAPEFVVMKFEPDGNVTSFEKKKTEFYQELGLQARDLRFQHLTSITSRNNTIIIRMESLKAIVTPESLLVLDFRGLGLEKWLVLELGPQLAGDGALVTYSLPFEFRALEAILQHRINTLQARLNDVQPQILDCLESLVDPKLLSADRSKLHMLLLNSKSLSELETDIKVFKDSLLKILDEDEMIEELCLTKWTDPSVFHRNVMMRLNLQLTMGTFSLSLFGLMGVAFGMNLESSFEEDPRVFWLVTGFMFLGSGLIWRRLLSFLGRHLEPTSPPPIPPVWRKNQISTLKGTEIKPGVR
ncbi:magnesium transporter MRS2 homolog, mitochondrial isoform X2 [Hoplias malabaricus]|uniref:magnesium transporter MRS2 homolog, mitochondrial isoform X2 n=1 Tax=Hoplias malabaricus TaxID=27720 RepID=UPI003461EA37